MLAGAGAAAGLLLSFWGSDLLLAQLRESDFRGLYAGADVRVLAFTALLAALSVCVFGLLPALAATASALLPRLRQTASAGAAVPACRGSSSSPSSRCRWCCSSPRD